MVSRCIWGMAVGVCAALGTRGHAVYVFTRVCVRACLYDSMRVRVRTHVLACTGVRLAGFRVQGNNRLIRVSLTQGLDLQLL